MSNDASKAIKAIDSNVDAFMAGRISYEEFTAKQSATWTEIQASRPVERKVLRTLRRRHAKGV